MKMHFNLMSLVICAVAIIVFWWSVYGVCVYWGVAISTRIINEIFKDAKHIADVMSELLLFLCVFLYALVRMSEFISQETRAGISKISKRKLKNV